MIITVDTEAFTATFHDERSGLTRADLFLAVIACGHFHILRQAGYSIRLSAPGIEPAAPEPSTRHH